MEFLNLNASVCRICLEHKVILNWNEEIFEFCGVSYKDCYYKYTQLDDSDEECYPPNLCEICADELKNAHFLFEKAMESFKILQISLNADEYGLNRQLSSSQSVMEFRIETLSDSKSFEIDLHKDDDDDQHKFSNETDDENIAESKNVINISEETSMIENVIIESANFAEIEKNGSFDEPLLQQQIFESGSELSSSNSKDYIKKRRRPQTLPKTSFEGTVGKACDAKKPKSERRNRREKCELTSVNETENNSNEKYTPKSGYRRRKYILICQYCSLKVNGTNQLRTHEATHSENRERTQICTICGVKLYTKLALGEHMKTHDENRQKKHKCEFCEKAFFHKGGLNVHRRIHLGLMVKCKICLKEFYRQIDLDKHLRRHSAAPLQKNLGQKKYVIQCQYCDKSVFTYKWKEHEAVHLEQPQVQCKICDKDFFSRSRCTKHLKQVHGRHFSEYEDLIHYYVDRNSRITNLLMKQQLKVDSLTK